MRGIMCFVIHYWPVAISVGIFVVIWFIFRLLNSSGSSVYFDAQDFVKYEGGAGRELPVSAAQGTFEPLLKHYISVTQLVVTIAAASITFGGNQSRWQILSAKLFLAFAILYGLLFCAAVLYRYDEYCQNVRSYTR